MHHRCLGPRQRESFRSLAGESKSEAERGVELNLEEAIFRIAPPQCDLESHGQERGLTCLCTGKAALFIFPENSRSQLFPFLQAVFQFYLDTLRQHQELFT